MAIRTTIRINGIRALTLLDEHAVGTGRIVVESEGSVSWREPGDEDAGESVTISAGETQILTGDSGHRILVERLVDSQALDTDEYALVQNDGLTSTRDLLVAVRAAIRRCLSFQTISSESGSQANATLDALRIYEKELIARNARESGTVRRVAACRMG